MRGLYLLFIARMMGRLMLGWFSGTMRGTQNARTAFLRHESQSFITSKRPILLAKMEKNNPKMGSNTIVFSPSLFSCFCTFTLELSIFAASSLLRFFWCEMEKKFQGHTSEFLVWTHAVSSRFRFSASSCISCRTLLLHINRRTCKRRWNCCCWRRPLTTNCCRN